MLFSASAIRAHKSVFSEAFQADFLNFRAMNDWANVSDIEKWKRRPKCLKDLSADKERTEVNEEELALFIEKVSVRFWSGEGKSAIGLKEV